MNMNISLPDETMKAALEPALNIANPPARSVGNFFSRTLDFWFSNRLLKYDKKDIMDELALHQFRKECEVEFTKIPKENLVAPRKALLLPALDAAEYYVEEEELRQMFARLIATTCDNRKASILHPSFAGIIQQLSPLDAKNLLSIHTSNGSQPVLTFNFTPIEDAIYYLIDNSPIDSDLLIQSTENLRRLGLIKIDFNCYLAETLYTPLYAIMPAPSNGIPLKDLPTRKGVLDLTTFGFTFCDICLPRLKACAD